MMAWQRSVAAVVVAITAGATDLPKLIGLEGVQAAHAAGAFNCSAIRNSSLGETSVRLAADNVYGDLKPSQLRNKLHANFWDPEVIEKAFTEVWVDMQDCAVTREIISEAQKGNMDLFQGFTTTSGHTSKSAVKSIDAAMRTFAAHALARIEVGQDGGSNYRYVRDRGLQAFLLNVKEKPALADQFPGISSLVASKWQEGFSLFVENTLKPSISVVPEIAAPKVDAPLKFE